MQTQSLDWLADQLVFVHLDITCWSGKKSLTPEDLGLDRARLPPETLVSLGEKQLVNPEALREFSSLRSAARRHCLAVGVRFLGGYAVPIPKARALLAQLAVLERRYHAARTRFLADYDGQLAAWAAAQPPEWQPLIRETLVPAEYVGGRLSFAVQAAQCRAPAPGLVAHDGLRHALSGLAGQVAREVAQLARETLEQSFQGKTAVTRRALGPFQAIRAKLDGLSCVDGGFRAIVTEIDRLLASIPPRLPIAGQGLEGLRQFLCLASQPDGLRTFAANAAPAAGIFVGWFGETLPLAGPAFDADAGAVEADAEAETDGGPEGAASHPDPGADPAAFARNAGESALEPLEPAPFEEDGEADPGDATELEPLGSAADTGWFF